MKVQFHNNQVEAFIQSLEKTASTKVFRTIVLLEKYGQYIGMPHSKYIEDGILELRIHGRQEVRLLYIFHKNVAVIVHGFIKKTNKAPLRDIEVAKKIKKQLDNI